MCPSPSFAHSGQLALHFAFWQPSQSWSCRSFPQLVHSARGRELELSPMASEMQPGSRSARASAVARVERVLTMRSSVRPPVTREV